MLPTTLLSYMEFNYDPSVSGIIRNFNVCNNGDYDCD